MQVAASKDASRKDISGYLRQQFYIWQAEGDEIWLLSPDLLQGVAGRC